MKLSKLFLDVLFVLALTAGILTAISLFGFLFGYGFGHGVRAALYIIERVG